MSRTVFHVILVNCCLAGTLVASNSNGQTKSLEETTISLEVEDKALKEVLGHIEAKTVFHFSYYLDDLNREKVTVHAQNQSLADVLRVISKQTKIGFKRIDNNIHVLRLKNRREPTVGEYIQAHDTLRITVTGKVTAEDGEGLPGVNVVLKTTIIGTVTDVNGNYQIEVPSEDAVLVFSSVGFVQEEVVVGNQTVIDMTMLPDITSLEEIVVVGYGIREKKSVTGSIATVRNEDLLQAPVANTSNVLAGRLPGLLSSQVSGEPGIDYASINIRGFGNALVIVDGVESSLNNVSPHEIADITILKDASAAIYGSRAGNGVILVTTKRGMVGKPTVNMDAAFSWQQPTIYPRFLNAAEYTQFAYDRDVRGDIDPASYSFPLSEVQKWKEAATPDYQSTDWWDHLMKDFAPFQRYNLSISGGSEKIKYYINYSRADQAGMLKSDAYNFSVNNFRSNVDAQITDAFSISGDLSAMKSIIDTPPREHSVIWGDITGVLPIWQAVLPDPERIPYTGNVTSIVASTSSRGGYKKKDLFQFAARLAAEYKIPNVDGLVAKAMVNYQRNARENKYWMIGYDMWKYNWANESYIREGSAWQTRLNEGWRLEHQITANIGLFYDQEFGDHSISVMALSEIIENDGKNISGGTDGFLGNSIDYLFAGSPSSARISGGAWEGGRVGYVGRLNYNYKSKYIIETTIRADGSPVFAPEKRWGFFPGISVAWRISEEPFIRNNFGALDNLKLRGGVSKSGFDGIGNFQYLTGYGIARPGVIDNKIVPGLGPTGIANPDITWEKITLYSLGVDFNVLGDKIYGSLDMFYRYRDDILAQPHLTVPSTFGADLPQMNINSASNRGLEFVIGHKNNKGALKYDVSANISFTRERNETVDEPEFDDPDQERIYKRSGQWTDLIWGLETDGLFTSQEEIDNYPVRIDSRPDIGNTTVRPGDIKYVDQNNDLVIDWRDQVVIGRKASIQRVTPNDVHPGDDYVSITVPGIMYGLNMNMSWKNFDFSALFQGGTGFSTWIWQSDYLRYYESWTEENNDPNALLPIQSSGPGPSVVGGASDYTLVDVFYLRLKTLNLGYSLPEKWLFGIKLRAYLSGTNVLTFSNLSKYKMDPEAPDGGAYYPQQKIYTIGFNVTF